MKGYILGIALLATALISQTADAETTQQPTERGEQAKITSYVDPFVGTSNYGTTNPGAVCPNGQG